MDEFSAKKLGEVLAFTKVGKDIINKSNLFTEKLDKFSGFEKEILKFVDIYKISEITLPKSEKTSIKLARMAEMYVGDEWDNPHEVMEWLGFFEGAAFVHWKLIEGVAAKLSDNELLSLTQQNIEFHKNFLEEVGKKIME